MSRSSFVAKIQALCTPAAASILLTLGLVPAQAQTDHWLTGYFAEYNSNGVMSPSQLDYTKLTHVIYWPALPSASSTNGYLNETEYVSQTQFDSDAKAVVAGAHAAGAKALLGVGGNASSGASAGFSALTTPAKLAGFVSFIVSEMQRLGFDGVDINWEEIDASANSGGAGNANDNAQFVAFITALRTKINTAQPGALLTMAPAVTDTYALIGTETTQQLIASVASDFDQLNIQTYIMAGPYCGWETWYNAPLNNGNQDFLLVPGEPLPTANNLIASYAAAGIPMSKMSIGIQFDAATWQGGTGTSTGGATKPYQTWTDDNCNSDNSGAPNWNTLPYRQMIATLAVTPGYTENFDSTADQNWLSYDPSGTGTTNEAKDEFVSYDSPQSIAKKGADLLAQEPTLGTLGGVMIFELSGDYAGPTAPASAQHPLLNAAFQMANLLPSAVTGLKATPSSTSISLSWTAAPYASSYQVYKSTTAGAQGSLIGTVASPTLVASALTPGTTYYFQVEPINSFGPSPTGIAKVIAATTGATLISPTIAWPTPAPIVYLQPLGSTQLDATASSGGATVAGTFAYSPAAGTKLTAGTHTLSVTFTPANPAAYTTATASVSITVSKATTVVSWPTPAPITTATPLSATQLDATASVPGLLAGIPGTFVYTPPAGTFLPAGANTLKVSFTPTDTADLTPASASVTQTVTGATLSASPNFGAQPIGVASAPHVFTFTFAKATTVSAIQVLTKGAPGLDFKNAGSGTCAAQTYAAGASCTVVVTFTPTASGIRAGAVAGLGAPLYIYGSGTGAQIAFDPGTPSQWLPPAALASFFYPTSVAVDGAGNTYIAAETGTAGAYSHFLYKVTPAGVFTTYAQISANQIAIDGAGNLFYTSATNPFLVGEIQPNGTQTILATTTGVENLGGIAVDPAGNLFFVLIYTNETPNSIEQLNLNTGVAKTTLIPVIGGAPVTNGCGLAVDPSDNLYISDCGSSRIVALTSAGVGSLVPSSAAGQIALGGSGILYIDSSSTTQILKWNPAAPAMPPVTVLQGSVLSNTNYQGPIAVDSAENIYVGDDDLGRLLEFNRQSPPTIAFPPTEINRTAAVQTVTVENIGNTTLTLPGSATSYNPQISANYVVAPLAAPAGATCEIGEGTASAAIPSLSACTYNIVFKPTVPGTTPGSLTFTENALNLPGSQQAVALSGEALPTMIGYPATLTATAGQNQIVLNWPTVTYATGYYVYRALASGGGATKIASTTANTYTDTTTPPGIAYIYVVAAYDSVGAGYGIQSAPTAALVAVPTGFTATVSGAFVNLSWNAVPYAQGYEVLRSTVSGGPYSTQIAETTTATTAQDATALPGTTYYYVVQAYVILTNPAAFDGSAFSPPVSAKTVAQKLPAPTGLTAYLAQGGGGATLTWSGVSGATGYNIYRSNVNGGSYKLIASNFFGPYLRYYDVPLPGGTYYWVVQALNSAGASPNSNQASLTVPNLPIPAVPTFSITVQDGTPEVTANPDGNVLFNFYRSSAKAGPYTLVETSDIYNFTDNNVVPGGTYYYELTASNNAGTSAFSAPQSTTVPLIPTILKATPGNGQVTLTWTAVPGATSYTADWQTANYPYFGTIATTSTSAVFTGLTNGTSYAFTVQDTAADGVSTSNFSAAVNATPVATQQTIAWIPDYYGQLLQVKKGSGATWTLTTVKLPTTCNPNSVAVNTAYAFVVCNANAGTLDEILVYNAATIRAAAAGSLTISPLQTYLGGTAENGTQFSELIGSAFDGSGNLWIASQGNSNVYSISAASLGTANPVITQQLSDSPSSPAGLAFATDGSLWVTGQVYDAAENAYGIVLNMPASQFGNGGQNPRYCLVSTSGFGCPTVAGIFEDPEGIAVVGSDIWVANNGVGGYTPGRQLVDLQVVDGALSVNALFGNASSTTASPFVCPGGLFATPYHLWINDESYGESTANLHCGGNGDVAAMTGGIFDYTPTQLTNKDTTLTDVLAFTNITGRPGFGGIFVENDQQ